MLRTIALLSLVIVLLAVESRGELVLTDEQPLFEIDGPSGSVIEARLSPDATTLLYLRVPLHAEPELTTPAQLVLRDLASGREALLGIGPIDAANGRLIVRSPSNFDPSGRLLALPNYAQDPPRHFGDLERPVVLCQTSTGRLAPTSLVDDLRYAFIDRTRTVLAQHDRLATLDGRETRRVTAPHMIDSLSPVGLVATYSQCWIPPGDPRYPNGLSPRLAVWDLARDELIVDLPVNPRNSSVDDYRPVWTSDGSFIYYMDDVDDPSMDTERKFARVYDTRARRVVGEVPEAWPLAPGPTPATVYLCRVRLELTQYLLDDEILLHDATTGALHAASLAEGRFHSAAAGRVVYQRPTPEGPVMFVATVEVRP